MKKNIIAIRSVTILMSIVAFLSTSCDDVLDEPTFSDLSTDLFWQTTNDANLGVAAIYSSMQSAYRNRYFLWGEFRSDNYILNERANATAIGLVQNNIDPNNNSNSWEDLYRMILRANLAIENIPNIAGASPDFLAEAHALRAFAYFDAIRVWGDVPLYTESINSQTQNLFRPRTDSDTILTEVIIPDILRAEELMTRVQDPYRFSIGSVWALMADIYMSIGDYETAREKLQNIVDSGTYSLVTTPEDWQNLFLNDETFGGKIQMGPELIFSINYDLDTNDNGDIYDLFNAGVPSYIISPDLENKWIETFPTTQMEWEAKYPGITPPLTDEDDNPIYGDFRYYFSRVPNTSIGESAVAKWNKTNYPNGEDDVDVVVYRYAGILYMLAECENRLNNADGALSILNDIRASRQLPLISSDEFGSTGEEREEFLLQEKRFEMLGEAKRWWDLRRTNRAIEILGPVNGLNSNTLLFPIFNVHIEENPELTQNPGYSN